MTDREKLMLYFVRKALGTADEPVPAVKLSDEEWGELFALAWQQAVPGLLIDGVAYTSLRPGEAVWSKWVAHLIYMERMNQLLEACGSKWLARLQEAGVRAALFKGTSVAQWYPFPRHRGTGDVDIVIREGWTRLIRLLQDEFFPYEDEGIDLLITDENLTVEFHSQWDYVYNPRVNADLQRMLRQMDGTDNELYLLCLILHLRRHFLTYGVGMKQVCDVAVMLRRAPLDLSRLKELLCRFRADKFSRVLFGFIQTYLGGADGFPLTPVTEGKEMDLFCQVVFRDGYVTRMKQQHQSLRARSSWLRIGSNAWFWFKRSLRMLSLLPDEAVWFLLYQTRKRIASMLK